jgi:phosphatidylglycerol:prolipoprotein diacylglycerol transferase
MPWIIRYFDEPNLGPFEPWGTLVALGVVIALIFGVRRTQKQGLDVDKLTNLTAWTLLGGFLGARLGHCLVYFPGEYLPQPLEIFKLWKGGMSSYGGFVGAIITGLLSIRKMKLNVWKYGDIVCFGLILGWTVGRLGCFVIFDHVGAKSDLFLSRELWVGQISESGALLDKVLEARHPLGLYEVFLSAAITVFFFIMARRPRFDGFYMGWLSILYAVPRFFMDFLRHDDHFYRFIGNDSAGIARFAEQNPDTRYFHLTPAQYLSIILLAVGIWIIMKRSKQEPQLASEQETQAA